MSDIGNLCFEILQFWKFLKMFNVWCTFKFFYMMLNNAILLFSNIFRLYFQNIYSFIGLKYSCNGLFKWLQLDSNPQSLSSETNTQPFIPVWLNGWVFVYELSGCGVQVQFQSLEFQILHLLRARSCLTFRQP